MKAPLVIGDFISLVLAGELHGLGAIEMVLARHSRFESRQDRLPRDRIDTLLP